MSRVYGDLTIDSRRRAASQRYEETKAERLDGVSDYSGQLDTVLYVYALLDPDTHRPRYIGQTANIIRRARKHSSAAYETAALSESPDKDAWIRECDGTVVIVTLDKASAQTIQVVEHAYIAAAVDAGCSIFNRANKAKRPERLSRDWIGKIQTIMAHLSQGDVQALPMYVHTRRYGNISSAQMYNRLIELEATVVGLAKQVEALRKGRAPTR